MNSTDNFLDNISNPEDYSCTVLIYLRGHKQLHVKAENRFKEDDFFILSFEPVWYFEGPMGWQGLNFRLGSLSERVRLLEEGWLNVGDLVNVFAEKHTLFIFERQRYKVQIFAGSFYVNKVEPNIQITF